MSEIEVMSSIEAGRVNFLRLIELLKLENRAMTPSEILEMLNRRDGRLSGDKVVQEIKDIRTVKSYIETLGKIYDQNKVLVMDKKFNTLKVRMGGSLGFSKSEVWMLIDLIYSLKYIDEKDRCKLVDTLISISGLPEIEFRNKLKKTEDEYDINSDESKSDFFKNIEVIYRARYGYSTVKKLKYKIEGSTRVVTPVLTVARNGSYYLICHFFDYSNLAYQRIELMKDVEIIENEISQIKATEEEIDNVKKALKCFAGDISGVMLRCNKSILTYIKDDFGENIEIDEDDDLEDYVIVTLNKVSREGIKIWAKCFLNDVTILEPIELAEELKIDLEESLKRYSSYLKENS